MSKKDKKQNDTQKKVSNETLFNETNNSKKHIKFSIIACILAVLVLLASIPLNLLASKLDINWDMTKNNMYSLSKATTDLVSSLDFDVNIYVLSDRDEMAEYYKPSDGDSYVMVKMLLNTVDAYDNLDNVTVTYINPTTEPKLIEELNPDGSLQLSDSDILVSGNGITKKISGSSMGYQDVDSLKYYFAGENYITGAIKYIIEGVEPTVYFLTGHGEKTLAGDYSTLQSNLLSNSYSPKELNLISAEKVPEDARIIIVPAPKSDITDAEKQKLDTYLSEGGSIAFLMSPNSASMKYSNIEKILETYNIEMYYDKVKESDANRHISNDEYTIMADLVEDTELTTDLMEMTNEIVTYMPASRSFGPLGDLTDGSSGLTGTPLMMTAGSAISEPFGGTAKVTQEETGQFALAYSIEDANRNDSKLIVMGNAEFIDDENCSQAYTIIPMYLFLSSISWMYNSNVDMLISPKTQIMDSMVINDQATANKVLAIIIAIPVIIAGIGTVVWLRRRHS